MLLGDGYRDFLLFKSIFYAMFNGFKNRNRIGLKTTAKKQQQQH